MATYNTSTSAAADILSSSVAVAAANGHFERTSAATAATTTTFIVPSSATSGAPLQLEPFITSAPHFVTTSSTHSPVSGTAHQQQPLAAHQQQHHHHHQQTNSTSTSYTFVQIKREPCQVSEVTSANCQQPQQQQQHHHHHQQQSCTSSSNSSMGVGIASSSSSSASIAATGTSKTMSSSSTLTTLVKIEASSPKVQELDKGQTLATLATGVPTVGNTNNSVPIGIAVARKRPQEASAPLSNSTAIPVQQSLNKDLNCFGIRVADLGGVSTGCGNIYFTGNGDLMTSSATTAEELALNAASMQSMNRAPSTFWQYQNALPIESVISMSPATVGLQYSRDASRGQVVLLPATPAALGISNFPLYTPTDPFQQAAAFVWPSYIPQGTTPAAAAAAATLQPPPNFIFPSMSPHSTLQPPSYATSLQLFGSNYLTAAAAAAAAAAATSTLCQHNQSNSNTSSINLSLGAAGTPTAGSSSTTSSSTSSRFLSLSTTPAGVPSTDNQKNTQKSLQSALTLPPPPAAAPLIIPPAAMKIEDWATVDFMSRANGTTTTLGHQPSHHLSTSAPAVSLNFESRDKTTTTTTTTTNLLELQNAANAQQALNLMRLPTPPTSATIETAAVAAAGPQLQPQLLFQATTSPSPALLNLSAANLPRASGGNSATVTPAALTQANFLNGGTTTLSATIGPPTPLGDETALNFKTSSLDTQQPQIVVGVPRVITNSQPSAGPPPQMQDVNIQTDTPVCSEDENSSCPLAIQQQHQQQQQTTAQSGAVEHVYAHDMDAQQPLELTKPHVDAYVEQPQVEKGNAVHATNECHNEGGITATTNSSGVGAASTSALQEEKCNGNEPVLQNTVNSCCGEESQPSAATSEISVVNEPINSSTVRGETAPEDLTGLELLSNISTSTLASKNMPMVRVKQEPLDHTDAVDDEEMLPSTQQQPQSLILNCAPNGEMQNLTLAQSQQPQPQAQSHTQLPLRPPSEVEPLGGLNLLCALAEQRIQEEEVQCGGNGLFASDASENNEMLRHQQSTPRVTPSFVFQQQQPLSFRLEQSFPSMEGIELPSTSGMCGGEPVKRKKHKHSKSSKSSSSASASTSGKKSQRCSKKAKKYSKEKRKHKLLSSDELDFDDEQLQEELKSALDPSYQLRLGKWTNAQEIFKLMESNMRMRLADITRQYRKKKRKLDEISKNKKKKKCSKLLAAQQQQQQQAALSMGGTSALSLVGAASSGLTCGSTSLPLCDYKFPKFSKTNSSVSGSVGAGATSTPYLNRSTFLRFGETATTPMSHAQFPPPDVDLCDDDNANQAHAAPSASSIYKPVRLGPSALAGAVAATDNRGSSILRLTQKHVATDKGESVIACKERKFMTVSSSSVTKRGSEASINGSSIYNGDECSANIVSPMSLKLQTQPQPIQAQQQQPRKPADPMDGQLMLTSDHLYRKETRVLTDMGGLFYAGIMKPLQPPDIYAITLDGERGNKPHIMSREEIFKDTILEVAPKSVESVPVGTRLCAYWSQQYRCLYPGRAIESESSDDGETPRDFVSVEFDDGDSGRIRLQNIRFLLSDYPIVEYNDNPLYSLGKHKKSGGKSGSHAAHDEHQTHEQPTSLADLPTSTANELQTNAAREAYAQRSEKKRIKSLKKKTQAALVASTTPLNGMGANESNECSRKHHKHKKRKKHKKHHHRKANEENEDGPNTFVIRTVAASSSSSGYVGKSEQQVAANSDDQDDEMAEAENELMSHVAEIGGTTVHKTAQSAIKIETTAATNGGVKVKTEHLELEEESASNMMSEVSDENKCDDGVEHNNSKGSKIAAFLPERQLWGWLGKAYRKAGVKGRARKQFYKTIKRGKETITVGDCAVFLSTGRPDRPYIGRIESMWETTSSNKVVRVRWFYHPEETTGCPKLKYPGALFESPHEDENDVQTISHRCEVLSFARYFGKFGADSKQYQSIYDNNDTYYLAGYYNPRLQVLNLQDDIPALSAEHTGAAADDNATANV